MSPMREGQLTILVAILCIATLAGIALACGINGKALCLAMSAIAGLAGFKLKGILG